jgi:hypothetical protein
VAGGKNGAATQAFYFYKLGRKRHLSFLVKENITISRRVTGVLNQSGVG